MEETLHIASDEIQNRGLKWFLEGAPTTELWEFSAQAE